MTALSTPSRWQLPDLDPARIANLAERLRLSPAFAGLLLARGFAARSAIGSFLQPAWPPADDARTFRNGEALIARLAQAVRGREPVLVHGDYDVDGICGAVIYRQALEQLGARVTAFLPSRFVDGYGVATRAIDKAQAKGVQVLLTADTGSQAYDAVQQAVDAGIAVCVTDHHQLGPRLPATQYFLNPQQTDCPYPFKGLSGGGIALKVMLALGEELGQPLDPESLLPFATLSTIADVCPLLEENRGLVREGLRLMQQPKSPGLAALRKLAGANGTVSAKDLSHGLIPRLNAPGRLDDPALAAQLLLSTDRFEAIELARSLDRKNTERKELQERVAAEAFRQAEQLLRTHPDSPALVVAGAQWHFGVVGIVAAKLVDAFGRPAICLTLHQSEMRRGPGNPPYHYTGSGRAPAGVPLLAALDRCAGLLEHHGGHDAACGVGLEPEKLEAFRERLNQALADLPGTAPVQMLDGVLAPSDCTEQLLKELARLEPCGAGNPPARFLIGPVKIVQERALGKENGHRALGCEDAQGRLWRGVQFGTGEGGPLPADLAGIVGTPVVNSWQGRRTIEWQVEEVVDWERLTPTNS